MADLDLTLLQADLFWEDPGRNLEAFDRAIRTLPPAAEVVLLPEMFTTGFTMQADALAETMDGTAIDWMRHIARERRIIVSGSLIIRDGDDYYNRLLWVTPDGNAGTYDKRHLFAFQGEHLIFTPGRKKVIASVKGWKVCLSICYDLRFPVWLRQPAAPEARYDLLVTVASWPESRAEAWSTLLRARAIENQCYVAGVNRSGTDGNGIRYPGGSCVFGPGGELLALADSGPQALHCVLKQEAITTTRRRFPFLDDADRFRILEERPGPESGTQAP